MRRGLLALAATALLVPTWLAAQTVSVIGRSPLPNVTLVRAGHFVTADIQDLLVLQTIGRMELARSRGGARVPVEVQRLALVRFSEQTAYSVWQSEPFIAGAPLPVDVASTAWATGDFDTDGLDELLMIAADSARLVSFGPDTITVAVAPFPVSAVEQAAACRLDSSGPIQVVTLGEVEAWDTIPNPQVDLGHVPARTYVVGIYSLDSIGWHAVGAEPLGLGLTSDKHAVLCGAARLEDYDGLLPVIAVVASELKPSAYSVVLPGDSGGVRLSDKPFPWQEWFAKERPLPSGPLQVEDVGDTLIAFGYFVPGARPGGPTRSCAALDDGEWRVLQFTPAAERLRGPVCRFTRNGVTGWLEVRDDLLYFYPGDIFRWR
jgi:hypothetical protein